MMKRALLFSQPLSRHERAEARQLLSDTGGVVVAECSKGIEFEVVTEGKKLEPR